MRMDTRYTQLVSRFAQCIIHAREGERGTHRFAKSGWAMEASIRKNALHHTRVARTLYPGGARDITRPILTVFARRCNAER